MLTISDLSGGPLKVLEGEVFLTLGEALVTDLIPLSVRGSWLG